MAGGFDSYRETTANSQTVPGAKGNARANLLNVDLADQNLPVPYRRTKIRVGGWMGAQWRQGTETIGYGELLAKLFDLPAESLGQLQDRMFAAGLYDQAHPGITRKAADNDTIMAWRKLVSEAFFKQKTPDEIIDERLSAGVGPVAAGGGGGGGTGPSRDTIDDNAQRAIGRRLSHSEQSRFLGSDAPENDIRSAFPGEAQQYGRLTEYLTLLQAIGGG